MVKRELELGFYLFFAGLCCGQPDTRLQDDEKIRRRPNEDREGHEGRRLGK